MTTRAQFEQEPRVYALEMVDEGYSAEEMLSHALKYMSHDDVRDMLDCNELSPRFTHACDWPSLKHDMLMTYDDHDQWGWAMLWRFEIADEMTRRGLAIPIEWSYKPGLDLTQDEDSYEQETLGLASDEALISAGNVLARYTRILEHQGKDY